MRALPLANASLAGITAFYCIIHIPREEVPAVLRELWRVLQPGSLLLLSFHIGDEVIHLDEWWKKTVSLDFTFFQMDEMCGYMESTGFVIESALERPPYENVEHPSRRAYILAGKKHC